MNAKRFLASLTVLIICSLGTVDSQFAYAATLKAERVFASPGKSVDVPVRLSDQDSQRPVAAIQFTLTYNGQLLTIVSKPTNGSLLEGATVITNPPNFPSSSGNLIITAFTVSENGFYSDGEDLFVSTPFQVKTGLSEQEIPLTVQVDVATDKDSFEMAVATTDGAVSIDATPPTGTISINNDADYTNTTAVDLSLSADDGINGSGVEKMRFKSEADNWSDWEAFGTTKEWTLTSTDSTKTVYAQYKDRVGNESDVYSDSIVLDTILPTTVSKSELSANPLYIFEDLNRIHNKL